MSKPNEEVFQCCGRIFEKSGAVSDKRGVARCPICDSPLILVTRQEIQDEDWMRVRDR